MKNFKRLAGIMGKDEIDALSEPSVMDEYIKESDPEQYKDIETARMYKGVGESFDIPGIGPVMGTVKNTSKPMLRVLEKMAGKADDVIPEEALSKGVKRIVSDAYPERNVEQEMISRLRQDPNIPSSDKREALKSSMRVMDNRTPSMDDIQRLKDQGFSNEEISELLSKYNFTID